MGRFINRDPLGYVDGMSLYNGYFSQRFRLDPEGTDDFVFPWDPDASWDPRDTYTCWKNLTCDDLLKKGDALAKISPAVGLAVQFDAVALGGGMQLGYNAMFFPESCQIWTYVVTAGIPNAMSGKAPKGSAEALLAVMPVGFSFGASATVVVGHPTGKGPHDADSWSEWFNSIGGSGGKFAGSVFWSEQWKGYGLGVGLKIPKLPPIPGGAAYSKQYYEPHKKWQANCKLCVALRLAVAANPITAARALMKYL
jgi:hypothetical protein